jgi:TDG/mug DNA glycosylase family protein
VSNDNRGDVLPDVLAPGLRVVFCGSAAGAVSARRGAYYAGPGNKFWPMLAAIGLTPRELRPEEFRELPRYGLGLTDICKKASGADADLPAHDDDAEALSAKIRRFRPRILAFVGKRPAAAYLGRRVDYGWQSERCGPTCIYVLPSPSGRARAFWNENPWRALATAVESGEGPRSPAYGEDA